MSSKKLAIFVGSATLLGLLTVAGPASAHPSAPTPHSKSVAATTSDRGTGNEQNVKMCQMMRDNPQTMAQMMRDNPQMMGQMMRENPRKV
jgi:hypothetical protein